MFLPTIYREKENVLWELRNADKLSLWQLERTMFPEGKVKLIASSSASERWTTASARYRYKAQLTKGTYSI